jgi:hypothetical protein
MYLIVMQSDIKSGLISDLSVNKHLNGYCHCIRRRKELHQTDMYKLIKHFENCLPSEAKHKPMKKESKHCTSKRLKGALNSEHTVIDDQTQTRTDELTLWELSL